MTVHVFDMTVSAINYTIDIEAADIPKAKKKKKKLF